MERINLNNNWKTAWNNSEYKEINIPHNWEDYHGYRQLSHGNLHGTAWYTKEINIEKSEEHVFLEFEGVSSYASIFVNDEYAGGHKGGRTSFTINITPYIKDGKNIITVKAEHPEKIDDLPWVCGGCYGTPNTEGSQPVGIFRPVHLLKTGDIRAEPFGIYINVSDINEKSAVLTIETEIKNYSLNKRSAEIIHVIYDKNNAVVLTFCEKIELNSNEGKVVRYTKSLKNPLLWFPDEPNLYYAETKFFCGNKLSYQTMTTFGIRTLKWENWDKIFKKEDIEIFPIDRLKLLEIPTAENNYFVDILENNKAIELLSLKIYVKEFNKDSCKIIIKTKIKNNSSKIQNINLNSFIANYDSTKFIGTLISESEILPAQTFEFYQESNRVNMPDVWSEEKPYLHLVSTTVRCEDEILLKAYTPFGILETDKIVNKQNAYIGKDTGLSSETKVCLLINNKPVFINGTCEYEHLLGNDHAFSDTQIDTRISQIKAAGFNAFREAHHPHNLRYLKRCEEEGLLYWPQMGSHFYIDKPEFDENYKILTAEWVKERRNSPAVILWGLQNESVLPKGLAEEATVLIRELDKDTERRTTTCNGGVGSDWNVVQLWSGCYGGDCNNYGDELKIHKLNGEYGQCRCLGFHKEGNSAQRQNQVAYTRVIPEEDFTYLLETKVRTAEESKEYVYGHFQWIFSTHANPGRDEINCNDEIDGIGVVNNKGLLTNWGIPLDAFYMYRSNYADKLKEPMVYISSHTWPDRFKSKEANRIITVYSNCDEAELFNDYKDQSFGTRKKGGKGTHFTWDNIDVKYNILYAEGKVAGKIVAVDYILLENLQQSPNINAIVKRENNTIQSGENYIYRINCGGDAYKDINGNVWENDEKYVSSWADCYDNIPNSLGSTGKNVCLVNNTYDDELFTSYRYGRNKLKYNFSVENGIYIVELYFSEPWYGIGGGMDCSSWRLFDVSINNEIVLKNFDIWKCAGTNTAYKKIFEVSVFNNEIEIAFPNVESGQAIISAIAISKKRIM